MAQDAHYATQQIVSSHLAGWNYAMLEYKLQKLSAALPNTDFCSQCSILEEWKRASCRVATLAADLQRVTADLQRVTAELQRVTAELQRITAERDALLSSTSWRLTAPLRVIVAAARRAIRL